MDKKQIEWNPNSMIKPFFVTDGSNKIGPFSKNEVMELLFSSRISTNDYIIDSRDGHMCLILQHEDFGGEGEVNLKVGASIKGTDKESAQDLSQRFGFDKLLNKVYKEREEREKKRQGVNLINDSSPSNQKPDFMASSKNKNQKAPVALASSALKTAPGTDAKATPKILEANTSVSIFIKIKDKEYGPLKFLILLSLLKQNKLSNSDLVRNEDETQWKKISEFFPEDIQSTIKVSPIINYDLLPKNEWKRKNIRLNYEEMIIAKNAHHSLVGKSLDLSADGIAVFWIYNVPLNEKYEVSLFDVEKNMITVNAELTRIDTIETNSGVNFYKAVFIFKEKIQIKNFIT